MKSNIVGLLLCLFLHPFLVAGQRTYTKGANVLFINAMSQINTRHVNWIKSSAGTEGGSITALSGAISLAQRYGAKNKMGNKEIETLAFLLLVQSVKNAEENVKAFRVKINERLELKNKLQDAINMLNKNNPVVTRAQFDSLKLLLKKRDEKQRVNAGSATGPVTKPERDELVNKLQDEKDSISEMGQQDMLLLQQAMDKKNELERMISECMKAYADVAGDAVQALKAS